MKITSTFHTKSRGYFLCFICSRLIILEAFSRAVLVSLKGLALQVIHGTPAYILVEETLLSLVSNENKIFNNGEGLRYGLSKNA
ncbi:hypothetical protein [Bacillus toyonensis]|uniref:Uncharacterized protein n=1 Tax=Bacillus toyonensis TaxID=155322 RepID=A0A2B5X1U5_9BACI|nr:hypothetical protein [Bacillus toyonensis]PGA89728.1 hypothetical protein COL93_28770 [Bacillus toyonensis]PHD61980.1 hypothetical protein COF40_26265 [Bacillus toyonensis]